MRAGHMGGKELSGMSMESNESHKAGIQEQEEGGTTDEREDAPEDDGSSLESPMPRD